MSAPHLQEGWTERFGPVCPVEPETLVEVLYYDGDRSFEPIAARYYDWSGSDEQHSPLMAYRVVSA